MLLLPVASASIDTLIPCCRGNDGLPKAIQKEYFSSAVVGIQESRHWLENSGHREPFRTTLRHRGLEEYGVRVGRAGALVTQLSLELPDHPKLKGFV